MSRSIDERIVEMKFNNKEFEAGIKESLKSIENLNKGLKFEGAAKGLESITMAARKIDLGPIESNLEKIAYRASALGQISARVIEKGVDAVASSIKGVYNNTIGLMKTGGMTRALNIEQAKFMLEGLGLDVEEVMKNANDVVDGTAYGLDEAAKVASVFGASGVKAGEDMTRSLRGVAGVAAMTGRDFSSIGDIFATVASNGKLMTMQLRQFSASGLNVSAALAKELGTTEAAINEMVSKGEIDFKTFADAMDNAFGEHAKDANKTFNGALANMKAAVKKIGQDIALPALSEMRDVFNEIRIVVNGVRAALQPAIGLLNNIIHTIAINFIQALKNLENKGFKPIEKGANRVVSIMAYLWQTIVRISKPIANAFNRAFTTEKYGDFPKFLSKLAYSFEQLIEKLGPTGKSAEVLEEILVGLFSNIRKGFVIIENAIKAFSPLLQLVVAPIKGVIDILYRLRMAYVKDTLPSIIGSEDSIVAFFAKVRKNVQAFVDFILKHTSGIPEVIAKSIITVVRTIKRLGDGFSETKSKIQNSDFGKLVADMCSKAISKLKELKDFVSDTAIPKFFEAIGKAIEFVIGVVMSIDWTGIWQGIKDAFQWMLDRLNDFIALLSGGKYQDVGDVFAGIKQKIIDLTAGVDQGSKSVSIFSKSIDIARTALEKFFNLFMNNKLFSFIKDAKDASDQAQDIADNVTDVKEVFGSLDKQLSKGKNNAVKVTLDGMTSSVTGFASTIQKVLGNLNLGDLMGMGFAAASIKTLFSLSGVFDSIGAAVESIGKTPKIIADSMNAIAKATADATKKTANGKMMLMMATSIGVIVGSIVALAIAMEGHDVRGAVAIVAGTLVALSAAVGIFTKLSSKANPATMMSSAAVALALSGSVLMIANALESITNIAWTPQKVLSTIITIGSILVVLAGITVGISKFSGFGGGVLSAVSVLILVRALRNVIEILKELTDTDRKKIHEGLIDILKILGILTVAAAAIGKFGSLKGALTLLGVVIALKVITAAIGSLASMPDDTWESGLSRLQVIIILLGGVVIAAGLAGENASKAAPTIAAIGVAVLLISQAIGMLAKTFENNPQGAISALFAIETIVWTFGILMALAMKNIGPNIDKTSKTFIAMGACILLISVAISMLAVIDKGQLIMATACIDSIILSLGGFLKMSEFAGEIDTKSIVAMLIGVVVICGLIMAMALGMKMIGTGYVIGAWTLMELTLVTISLALIAISRNCQNIDIKPIAVMIAGVVAIAASLTALAYFGGSAGQIITAAGALVVVFGSIALALKLLSSNGVNTTAMLEVATSMLILSGAIGVLSASIALLSQSDPVNVAVSTTALVVALAAMAAIAYLLAPVGPALVAVGTGMLLMGGAVLAVGAGIFLFTKALETLTKIALLVVPALYGLLQSLEAFASPMLQTIGNIIGQVVSWLVSQIPVFVQQGIDIMVAFINGLADGVRNNTQRIIDAVINLFEAIVTAIVTILTNVDRIWEAAKRIFITIWDALYPLLKEVPDLIKRALSLAVDWIKRKVADFRDAAKNLVLQFLNTIKEKIMKLPEIFKEKLTDAATAVKNFATNMMQAAIHMMQGMIRGIENKAGDIIRAIIAPIENGVEKVKKFLGIASPSRLMEQIFTFFIEGGIIGVTKNADRLTGAVESVGEKALNAMNTAVCMIQDAIDADYDLSPVITPVIDMTNADVGFAQLDNMMSQRTLQIGANANIASVGRIQNEAELLGNLADTIASSNNNSDVVDAISEMRSDISDLKSAMANLRVVMDTGQLVGAIAPEVDIQLGRLAIYGGRGM